MKYLKYININESELYNKEILEFTENHLAYLIDLGYTINTYNSSTRPDFERRITFIDIKKEIRTQKIEDFSWDEVKDYIIPFLSLLKKRFSLANQYSSGDLEFSLYREKVGNRLYDYDVTKVEIDNAISDNLPDHIINGYIARISFGVY